MSNINDDNLITRREFTVESALALLAGVTITVSGCGGGTDSPSSPSPSPTADVMGSVSANHGHVATVTAAQMMAGGVLSLDIRGSADHPHTITLTADEVSRIAARTQVSKTSSSDNGHTHTVTFN